MYSRTLFVCECRAGERKCCPRSGASAPKLQPSPESAGARAEPEPEPEAACAEAQQQQQQQQPEYKVVAPVVSVKHVEKHAAKEQLIQTSSCLMYYY